MKQLLKSRLYYSDYSTLYADIITKSFFKTLSTCLAFLFFLVNTQKPQQADYSEILCGLYFAKIHFLPFAFVQVISELVKNNCEHFLNLFHINKFKF